MEEQWRDIIGYEGLYQISNFGRVKSLKYHRSDKERILKPKKEKNGYLQINLYKDEKLKTMFIHRLVANAFIPNEDIFKTQINHKDENKENNNVNNLEFSTPKENSNYGTRNERMAKAKINHPKKSKQVNQYSLDGNFIRSFPSTMEIERQLGFSNVCISACCLGKQKTAYNYIWKYINNEES